MKKRILVVDDDKDILEVLEFILGDAGYEVESSEKGEFAGKLPQSNDSLPNLIILDVLLSGLDGRDICRNLKKAKSTKNIPIIMMSAHPDAEKSSKKAGADDFLAKPFEMTSLLNKVASWVN